MMRTRVKTAAVGGAAVLVVGLAAMVVMTLPGGSFGRGRVKLPVGTQTNWAAICACGLWWCQGLVRKDGSFWVMDASGGEPNGPGTFPTTVRFKRIDLPKDIVAYTAGAAHAAAPGIHAPIGVALTRDGDVWTWGLMLGDPRGPLGRLELSAVRLANRFGYKGRLSGAGPVIRQTPWLLTHVEP